MQIIVDPKTLAESGQHYIGQAGRLDNIAGALESALKRTASQWTGDAREAFIVQAQQVIMRMRHNSDVLRRTGQFTIDLAERYAALDADGTNWLAGQ